MTDVQPAPWVLHGDALIGFKLVREDLVRRLVPPDATVIRVLPGRTLAMLYLSQYRQSPVGEYREFIFSPALLWRGGRIGFWVSHIYVDSDLSMAAGRAIWSLPKQLASIQWGDGCVGLEGPQVRLQASFTPPRTIMPLPFFGAAMSSFGSTESWFPVRGSARVGFASVNLDASDALGLDELGFRGISTFFFCQRTRVTIGRPRQ